jgi:hypothetical protein
MSNTIDVLCVGGPANGRVFNTPRVGKLVTLVEGAGDVTYTRQAWTDPLTGAKYHIATRVEDGVNDDQIVIEIVLALFNPAWDLNPPYTQMALPA